MAKKKTGLAAKIAERQRRMDAAIDGPPPKKKVAKKNPDYKPPKHGKRKK